MKMHSTKISLSTAKPSSSSSTTATTTNVQQYHYPPLSALRRSSRPSNINLPVFDHNNGQANDPGIYSAPICYIKQPYHVQQQQQQQQQRQQQHIHQTSQPYTAALPYLPQQHMQMSSHSHSQQQTPQLYQQEQTLLDPFTDHQHAPRTFPLQGSPNHYHQYFYFPPPALPNNATSNGHQSTNTSQPSTPTHANNLRLTQRQEASKLPPPPQQQQWSNPALSSLLVKRMNDNPGSMPIDDDEDPSASIDALVADVDSNSQDMLDDEQNRSIDQSKTSSTIPIGTIRSLSHMYIRSKSHILTTPPNPLASDDHPDNQIQIENNYKATYSPLPSAGFELTTKINNKSSPSSSSSSKTAQCFTFDANLLNDNELKNQQHENLVDDNDDDNTNDIISKPLIINADKRISSNSLIQDDNSNHSSTNSISQNGSSKIFCQMLQSSEQRVLSSSSSLSNDIKSVNLDNMQSSIQHNRLSCTHPDCNKTFTNKSALAKHKLTHSQDRKHVCSKCNKGFKRLDHLNGHMLTHEEEKPHKCLVPNCNRTYCDARSLKRHVENTHQEILIAIGKDGNEEYKRYLPDTAIVKIKELSLHNEFSIDSVDSNSPRSLNDAESSFNIRTSTGTKTIIYTYDEEKCIECHVCKKTFKNTAALNGHMRLHGGYIDKQVLSPSTATKEKTKRSITTKRKRTDSSSMSINIKREAQDISKISSNNVYQRQSSFSHLSTNANTFQQQHYDRTISSPVHPSSSSSLTKPITSIPLVVMPHYVSTNSLNIQSSSKSCRKIDSMHTNTIHSPQINIPSVIIPFDKIKHGQLFTGVPSSLQPYEEQLREPFANDNNIQLLQSNGIHPHNPYNRSSPYQSPSTISQFYVNSSPPISTNAISSALKQHFHIQNGEQLNSDFNPQLQTLSSIEDHLGFMSEARSAVISTSNSTPKLIIKTHTPSPNSNQNTSHHNSSLSPVQKCNNDRHTISTISTDSSIQSSSHVEAQKPIENLRQDEIYDFKQEKTIENNSPLLPAVLEIIPDVDESSTKKGISGFLINTPSSTGTGLSSSSSTSSHTHFPYDEIPEPKKPEPTLSSFQWPSQLRRQLSLNLAKQTLNPPLPSTPYTPPPMLSPFRRGPGLYYRVFSQPGITTEPLSIPTTPLPSDVPSGEDSSAPKINIGKEYQAMIPKLKTKFDDDDTIVKDELLFSPSSLSCQDEKSLEKLEHLNQMDPFLFSSRDSPKSYPLELIYMLLHEYNGDLKRMINVLLEGTANDIKQCRPIHTYRFLDSDEWTREEIEAFTKAIQASEKNFELVSRAVGTKTIKQCIEFHYMPKVSSATRKISLPRTSTVMTRRKRFQINRAQQQQFDDDISSSSPFSEIRIDDDSLTMNSDGFPTTQISCDINECSQTFTSKRAFRAHRKDHRRTNHDVTSCVVTKRNRNID